MSGLNVSSPPTISYGNPLPSATLPPSFFSPELCNYSTAASTTNELNLASMARHGKRVNRRTNIETRTNVKPKKVPLVPAMAPVAAGTSISPKTKLIQWQMCGSEHEPLILRDSDYCLATTMTTMTIRSLCTARSPLRPLFISHSTRSSWWRCVMLAQLPGWVVLVLVLVIVVAGSSV